MGICSVLDFVVVLMCIISIFFGCWGFCAVWVMKGKKGKVYLRFYFPLEFVPMVWDWIVGVDLYVCY